MQLTTRLYVVRHGETEWNAAQRIQGHRNLPLNQRGFQQAEAVGCFFSDKPLDAVYSSDLLRAQQTAQPIAASANRQTILRSALRERNYGRCEGLTREQLIADFIEDAHALKARNPDYAPPGGESLRQHQQRIFDCLEDLIANHPGQNIVAVTHGGVLDLIYRRITGMALDEPRNFAIPNAGINLVSIDDDQWSIEYWGEIRHL